MSKSRVFVTQIPKRRDPSTNIWHPTVDVQPASEFGDIITMLPERAAWMTPADLKVAVEKSFADNFFNAKQDFIILMGSPLVMAVSSIAASRVAEGGELKVLVWDRSSQRYIPRKVLTV